MHPLLIVLCVIGGLLLVAVALFFLGKIKIRIRYEDKLRITLSVLGFRAKSATGKEVKSLYRETRKRRKEQKKENKKNNIPEPNLMENLEMISTVVKHVIAKTNGRLKIRVRALKIHVATGDAAATALLYGAVVGVMSALLQWIQDHVAHLQRKDGEIDVAADYLLTSPEVNLDIELKMTVFHAISLFFSGRDAFETARTHAKNRAKARLSKKTKAN
jgi:hypothetical protein